MIQSITEPRELNYEEFMELYRKSPYYERAQAKIKKIVARHYNRLVENAIRKELGSKDIRFTRIGVREKAHKKAAYLSNRVSEMAGKHVELSMAMTRDGKNAENTVYDFHPFFSQGVQSAACFDTSYGIGKAKEEFTKSGEKYLGWAHSHGGFSTFLSSRDLRRVDLQMYTGHQVDLDLGGPGEPNIFKVFVLPLMVYNERVSKGETPYSAIAVGYLPLWEKKEMKWFLNENVDLEILPDDRPELDTASLDNLLLERVHVLDNHVNIDDVDSFYNMQTRQYTSGRSLREIVESSNHD